MRMKPTEIDPELNKRLQESIEAVKRMTPEELEAMHKAQRESWSRSCITNPRQVFRNVEVIEKDNND